MQVGKVVGSRLFLLPCTTVSRRDPVAVLCPSSIRSSIRLETMFVRFAMHWLSLLRHHPHRDVVAV